ncbi:MAG: glycoside hydrolase family 3 protein [Ilumatobacter sp.]|nr:glycoside hydrolase family 3 protein [Ilumatobacter sp.]
MIDIDAALSALSLTDKCRLLAGQTTWRTKAYPDAGVPALKMSDGPNGVRGEGHGAGGTPGVVVPAGITLGATWDPELVGEIGELLGKESRRKRAHVLLGPTINLHRTPLGGRTFECYSEDPELSGALGAAYVRGVQSQDVAVTVKHFVCNDTEIERLSVDVRVDERPLRELYLRPFERVVAEAAPWGVMSAYNKLDGEHCAENRRLLTDILRTEWGFDGAVVSDWFGVHHTAPAANAGLNIEMPAPVRVYGRHLEDAVARGEVDEAQVDALVRDVLVLANRVHADERDADAAEESADVPAERSLTRRAAVAGTVLLVNDDIDGVPVLPLDAAGLAGVAVIGPNAAVDRSMGGGSASLVPLGRRTLIDAVTDRIGPGTTTDAAVAYEPGVRIDRLTPVLTRHQLRAPDGTAGLHVAYVNGTDWDGDAVLEQTVPTSMLRFFGSTPDGVDATEFSMRINGTFLPDTDGLHTIGVVSTGPVRVTVGDEDDRTVVVDDPDMELPRSEEFFGYGSVEVTVPIECVAGRPVPLAVRWSTRTGNGFAALRVGVRPPEPADLMDRAVAAAAAADAAIVVVGTNDEWETEGFDRTTMDLPGRQDELVRRVVAANPRTVVIVNAGSPVTMDWADAADPDRAPAVLTSFFAGQEQAEALVDVVLGEADPGGRLPLTIPARLADHPALLHHRPDHDTTGAGVQRYGEGLFVGYRAYDARSIVPRFPFGHGLSYGTASWGAPTSTASTIDRSGSVDVTVPITGEGERPATVVVGGYVAAIDPPCIRPPKELRSWKKVIVAPGETTDVTLTFGPAAFHRWDPAGGTWVVEAGDYDIVLAASATDERHRVRVTIT